MLDCSRGWPVPGTPRLSTPTAFALSHWGVVPNLRRSPCPRGSYDTLELVSIETCTFSVPAWVLPFTAWGNALHCVSLGWVSHVRQVEHLLHLPATARV